MDLILYIHGKGGGPAEAEHYRPLFPGCEVEGLDYRASTPWEAAKELREAIVRRSARYDGVTLVANSIGAFFSMHADIEALIGRAYFISPIVDMEKLILDMMRQAGVTEAELEAKGTVRTASGEELSWEYLRYVREHPLRWRVPTEILYGSRDALTSFDTISAFAGERGAGLTVMENGEHWFHTPEQMLFLDRWIREKQGAPSL